LGVCIFHFLIRSLYSAIRVKKNELPRNHPLLIDGIGNFFEFSLKANKTPHLARLFACKLELPAACGPPAEFNRWHFLETLFKQGN
jgi:hypothetical protein